MFAQQGKGFSPASEPHQRGVIHLKQQHALSEPFTPRLMERKIAIHVVIVFLNQPLNKNHRQKTCELSCKLTYHPPNFSPLLTRLSALFTAFLKKEKPISSPPLKGSTFTSYLLCMHISLRDAAEMYYVHCTILFSSRLVHNSQAGCGILTLLCAQLTFNIWSQITFLT